MYATLFEKLTHIKPITAQQWQVFEPCLTEKYFSKNTIILQAGDRCKGVYFIAKGAIRAYIIKDGNEINSQFCFENDFATDFESLTKQIPSAVYLETLEETHAIYCDREKMLALYKEAPIFESIGRSIAEQLIVQQNKYAALFTHYSPAERYQHVVKEHPALLQRVPLQLLASYLGITRETLSRIRKRLN